MTILIKMRVRASKFDNSFPRYGSDLNLPPFDPKKFLKYPLNCSENLALSFFPKRNIQSPEKMQTWAILKNASQMHLAVPLLKSCSKT